MDNDMDEHKIRAKQVQLLGLSSELAVGDYISNVVVVSTCGDWEDNGK